jgi:hypothetical protein
VVEQRIWRKRTNQELQDLYKDLNKIACIKKKRFEWIGHIVIMGHGGALKKISESKPEGRRRMGRSRLRWLEDVSDDLREMKFKRWRQKAVDRDEWAYVIMEAEALRGP